MRWVMRLRSTEHESARSGGRGLMGMRDSASHGINASPNQGGPPMGEEGGFLERNRAIGAHQRY